MDSESTQAVRPRPYWPFLPLFFSLLGTALLNAWLHLMAANYRAHLIAIVLGTVFTAWSLFPVRGQQSSDAGTTQGTAGRSGSAAVLKASLFLLLGASLGGLVINGSLFLLGTAAAALNFVPWRRLAFGRQALAVPCLLACCGFGSVLFAGWPRVDLMFLPLATWAFWTATLIGLFWRIERRWTAVPSKGKAAPAETAPAACDT